MHTQYTPSDRTTPRNTSILEDFDGEFLRRVVGEPREDNSIWHALGLVPGEFDLEAVQ
ncbi:MAG: hypothetical protein QM820_47025 [Minicystis sp.]